MEFPQTVRAKIEELTKGIPAAELKRISESLSERYRKQGVGKRVLTEKEAAVYAAARMPATFGAVRAALGYALECLDERFGSLMDVGAGTGAAVLAADSLIAPPEIVCLERETAMRRLGQELMDAYKGAPADAVWSGFDVTSDSPPRAADLVIASYMLNELLPSEIDGALAKLWATADKMLLIVEPGTPAGYKVIKAVREGLIARGAYIAAPCPHAGECPATADNWCHFGCRVARSRLQKLLKGGDVPYEDEKFTYIAASKKPCVPASARIMRHPFIGKGRISLELCTEKGFEKRVVTARDKEGFRAARKAKWGGNL